MPQLSKQVRRFLDDQAWLENRCVTEILHDIEANALAVRAQPPPGEVSEIELPAADINLGMERPLAGPEGAIRTADSSGERSRAVLELPSWGARAGLLVLDGPGWCPLCPQGSGGIRTSMTMTSSPRSMRSNETRSRAVRIEKIRVPFPRSGSRDQEASASIEIWCRRR